MRSALFLLCLTAGCTSATSRSLNVGIAEFNAKGTSWRALESRGEYRAAAQLLAAYATRHAGSLAEADRVLLHFHAAQEFAFAGDGTEALQHLARARYAVEPSSFPMRWNDYVAATEAFLRRDRAGLLAARERIASGPKWNGEILTLNVVDSLIEHFGEPYLAAYTQAPKSPNTSPESVEPAAGDRRVGARVD